MEMKVRIELLNGKNISVDMDASTQLTKNFTLGELANNKGISTYPKYVLNKDVDVFLAMLQDFRLWYKKPIRPNSSYRQESWNTAIGGAKNSLHLKGLAIDFNFPEDFSERDIMNCVDYWKTLCTRRGIVGEFNIYKTYFHLGAFADKNGYRSFQCRDYRKTYGSKKYTLVKV